MKIADGVDMLKLSMNMGGIESKIFPTLIHDENNLILVDVGLPGELKKIRNEIAKVGAEFDKLNKIIITHQDIDHIGGLTEILGESDHKIFVLAHEDDKPFIEGDKRLNKITPERRAQLEEQFKTMTDDQRKAMHELFQNPPTAKVDETLDHVSELPYCGGIIVIHTPGHTPGHICLYLKQTKILIAGDMLNIIDGELVGPNPQNTPDIDSATASIEKFLSYDIEKIVTYHGGLFTSNPNQTLVELACKKS